MTTFPFVPSAMLLPNNTESASFAGKIFRDLQKGITDPVKLWARQTAWSVFAARYRKNARKYATPLTWHDIRIPFSIKTAGDVAWLVDEKRFDDLGIEVLIAFRDAAFNAYEPNKAMVRHLPQERIAQLKQIFSSETHSSLYGPAAHAEQMALMFHITRLGGNVKTCQQAFKQEIPHRIAYCARRITGYCYDIYNMKAYPLWKKPGLAQRVPLLKTSEILSFAPSKA